MKRIQAFEHGTAYKMFPQLPFHAACNPLINVVTIATCEHERYVAQHRQRLTDGAGLPHNSWRSVVRNRVAMFGC